MFGASVRIVSSRRFGIAVDQFNDLTRESIDIRHSIRFIRHKLWQPTVRPVLIAGKYAGSLSSWFLAEVIA